MAAAALGPGVARRRGLSVHSLETNLPARMPYATGIHHDPQFWQRCAGRLQGRAVPWRVLSRLLLGTYGDSRGCRVDESRLDGGVGAGVSGRKELASRNVVQP